MKRVVILVDNKVRDLNVAVLIAHHLKTMRIDCRLEPLEAYRAVIADHRPDMVIFNHLVASHLVEWSKHLAEIGVLVAVLPNEGILYDRGVLEFNAGRHHNGAHIDYFFCWNEAHRQAILQHSVMKKTQVETIGVPRFDFYFAPWFYAFEISTSARSRPQVLFCTNFTTAKFSELPKEHGDRFFAAWSHRIALYRDYWSAIESHCRSRRKALDYVVALAAADKFDIVLRPHPNEDADFYVKWVASLAGDVRKNIRLDRSSNIMSLILNCDIEISCETCTTALESWIAKKPTIELIFEKHPLWYREIQARGNVECNDPQEIVSLVKRELEPGAQEPKQAFRDEHLATWCASPAGTSSLRLAEIVAQALASKQAPDWSKLSVVDHRRALKLKLTRVLGVAYHFAPLLRLKYALWPRQYRKKYDDYAKSIKPADVAGATARLNAFKST